MSEFDDYGNFNSGCFDQLIWILIAIVVIAFLSGILVALN